jgi:RNA polymerase sigma factor (sigma-70 family)
MTVDRRSDAALLAAAARDNDAFAVFYRRHVDRVLRYFALRTSDPEQAADLMAETFAAAFIAAPRFRGGGEPPVAWLFKIAQNKLTDARRRGAVRDRARRRLGLEPLVLEDADLAHIEDLAAATGIADLLTELSDDEREAVKARIVDERAYDEIARELRCSPAVVRQRVSRGLRRMRAVMDGRTE